MVFTTFFNWCTRVITWRPWRAMSMSVPAGGMTAPRTRSQTSSSSSSTAKTGKTPTTTADTRLSSSRSRTSSRRARVPASLREQVWNEYVGRETGVTRCPVCQEREITPFHFHCGHVVADALGGETTVPNLRPICSSCNMSMSTMDMREYLRRYHPDNVARVPRRMKL